MTCRISMKPAVVLLSGGIDSTTTLAIAIAEAYEPYALSFDYGQRHCIETEAARRVANSLGAKEHRIAKIDLRVFGGSALTGHNDVPKQRSEKEIGHGIPITYVPARNTIFLSFALAWAEVIEAADKSLRDSGGHVAIEPRTGRRQSNDLPAGSAAFESLAVAGAGN